MSESENTKKVPASGEQYLKALFVAADWIPAEYRELATGLSQAALRELYMCACDEVPYETAKAALEKKNQEQALHLVRLKKIEDEALSDSSQNLSELIKRTEGFEEQMRMISETVSQIALQGATLQDAFESEQEALPKEEEEKATSTAEKVTLPVNSTKRLHLKLKVRTRKRFVERLIADGYNSEQLQFICDCLEAGMSEMQIKSFASQKLPVEVMRRLKNLKFKEEIYG